MKTNHPTTTIKEIRDDVAEAIRNAALPTSLKEVLSVPYRSMELFSEEKYIYGMAPTVTVVGRGVDENTASRGFKSRDVTLFVFLEGRIDSTKEEQIEQLITLNEALMTVCSNERGWLRNMAVSDETDTPFLFHVLRQHSIYQGIFAPVYFQVKDRRIFA
jgi:hypothetical protein